MKMDTRSMMSIQPNILRIYYDEPPDENKPSAITSAPTRERTLHGYIDSDGIEIVGTSTSSKSSQTSNQEPTKARTPHEENPPSSNNLREDNDHSIQAETNVNWSQHLKNKITAAMRLQFGSGQVIPASSKGTKEEYLQSGGVAMFVTGPANGRIVARGSDAQGRFSWVHLTSPGGKGIIVITAYCVCQTKGTLTGFRTTYMQQVKPQLTSGTSTPDPRGKILEALTIIISKNQMLGYQPIVMLDANEDWEASGDNTFHNFMIRNGLIDIHQDRHAEQSPSTYIL